MKKHILIASIAVVTLALAAFPNVVSAYSNPNNHLRSGVKVSSTTKQPVAIIKPAITRVSSATTVPEIPDTEKTADDIFKLVNETRKKADVSELLRNTKLTEAAVKRAQESADMENINHERPDGEDWVNILEEYDIKGKASWWGENLAANTAEKPDAEFAIKLWTESTFHYENMVRPDYTHVGIGVAKGKDGNIYYCQIFIQVSKGKTLDEK